MTGRTARETVRNFITTIQKSVSCVTDAVIDWRRALHDPVEELTVGDRRPVWLRGTAPLLLKIRIRFRVAKAASRDAAWPVATVAYFYSLADEQEREILAYQWHPRGLSRVTFPHLHIGPGAQLGRQDLARAHLPTGLVALDDFLRLAITAFHVRPRRKDWADILGASATLPIPLE